MKKRVPRFHITLHMCIYLSYNENYVSLKQRDWFPEVAFLLRVTVPWYNWDP